MFSCQENSTSLTAFQGIEVGIQQVLGRYKRGQIGSQHELLGCDHTGLYLAGHHITCMGYSTEVPSGYLPALPRIVECEIGRMMATAAFPCYAPRLSVSTSCHTSAPAAVARSSPSDTPSRIVVDILFSYTHVFYWDTIYTYGFHAPKAAAESSTKETIQTERNERRMIKKLRAAPSTGKKRDIPSEKGISLLIYGDLLRLHLKAVVSHGLHPVLTCSGKNVLQWIYNFLCHNDLWFVWLRVICMTTLWFTFSLCQLLTSWWYIPSSASRFCLLRPENASMS